LSFSALASALLHHPAVESSPSSELFRCKATQIYLILCEASSGLFSQSDSKVFQNISCFSLFLILDRTMPSL